MPLSAPAAREALHHRAIDLRGYARADGLFDVEAHLVDTKSYPFENQDRGRVEPGVPLHGMWARMTVDIDMVIVRFEAVTEYAPYAICPQAAPNFAALAGLQIGRGFIKKANERIGGTHGCTHLRELLQPMATVALQSLVHVRQARAAERRATGEPQPRPAVLETCLAYATDSPVVQRTWPQYYTGSEREPAPEPAAAAGG